MEPHPYLQIPGQRSWRTPTALESCTRKPPLPRILLNREGLQEVFRKSAEGLLGGPQEQEDGQPV